LPGKYFSVLPFSADNLAAALSNKLTSETRLREKMHFIYFNEYLGSSGDGLHAQTMVIENQYVSKSYLMDFSSYYSTCFGAYDRFCKRVHFFSSGFSLRGFQAAVKTDSKASKSIWDSYLGYIVVKPLPAIIIGATVLKTYPKTVTNKRFFPSVREYTVNLFGKELYLDSLAFQEQDSVVGACASSALWTAFHKTSQLFQHPLPSPSDITRSAKNLFENSGRTFPNSGLDHYQIGNAIESVGLVSELRNSERLKDQAYLKAFIYAYNRMGLPILLGIKLDDTGGHLITICGYKESNDLVFPRDIKMALKASKMERLYAHDDQVGPFSKLGFAANGKFETSWLHTDGTTIQATLVSLFVPLQHKIRLTFENIYSKVSWMDFYFLQRLSVFGIYWDIYLDFSNEYKKSLRRSVVIEEKLKIFLLEKPLPKYVWIAKALLGNESLMELVFDATQIATADSCVRILVINNSLKTLLSEDLQTDNYKNYFKEKLDQSFLDLLIKSCSGR
jgi:hypothetical protein